MKRYILWAVILSGIALFGFSASAETIYQTNDTDATLLCWSSESGEPADCGGSFQGTWDNTMQVYLWQDLLVNPSSADPEIPLSAVSFWVEEFGGSGGNHYTATAYFMDDSDWDVFVANGYDNVIQARATSTPLSFNGDLNGWAKVDFPTPYTVDISNSVSHVVFKIVGPASVIRGIKIGTTNDSYPTSAFTNFSWLWSGGARATDQFFNDYGPKYFENLGDLRLRLYREDTQLTITSPPRSALLENPFNISGTCQDTVTWVLYDNALIASSTEAFYFTDACSANVWSRHFTSLNDGSWYIDASSTGQFTSSVFYWNNYEGNPLFPQYVFPSWSCEVPYFSFDPCAAVSSFTRAIENSARAFAYSLKNLIETTPPFSYPVQIYDAVQVGLSTNASSTLALTVPVFGQQTLLADISQTPVQSVSQSQWNTMRPYFELVLYGSFIIYLLTLIRRFT